MRADFATGAMIGGWSSSCSDPLPARLAGARAADDDQRRAAELGLRDRTDPVGEPGSGGEHREPRRPGELAHGLGGERCGLLVAHVDDAHRRVGGRGAVVHREDVGARQREHRLDAVGPRHRDGVLAGVGRVECSGAWSGAWVMGARLSLTAPPRPAGLLGWAGAVDAGARPGAHRPLHRRRGVALDAARRLADHRRPQLRQPGAVAARGRRLGLLGRRRDAADDRPDGVRRRHRRLDLTGRGPASPGRHRAARGPDRAPRATRSGATTSRCASRRSLCAAATG